MKLKKNKIFRITTVPLSLKTLLKGQCKFVADSGFEVVGISSSGTELLEVGSEEGIRVVGLDMTRKISPFRDLLSLIKFIRLCIKEQPLIIHSHTPKAGIVAMLGAKLAGIPIRLHTVAGLPLMETQGIKRVLLEYVEKITYACATKVYPNSAVLMDYIVSSGLTKQDKLKVIGNGSSNGINTELFRRSEEISNKSNKLRDQYNLSSENFIFLFVGRIVKDKGIEELVSAFDELHHKHPNLRLLMVGSEEKDLDPLSENCLRLINSNDSIITTGFQTDVRPYLGMSDVLVFPSYREGFPNVPMQAGCFHLPAIVTNINGCNEIIVEGKNGVIIPVKDAISLYKAMERTYLDKDLYSKMSSNARKMIVDRYDQKKIWSLVLDEYKIHLTNNGLV